MRSLLRKWLHSHVLGSNRQSASVCLPVGSATKTFITATPPRLPRGHPYYDYLWRVWLGYDGRGNLYRRVVATVRGGIVIAPASVEVSRAHRAAPLPSGAVFV